MTRVLVILLILQFVCSEIYTYQEGGLPKHLQIQLDSLVQSKNFIQKKMIVKQNELQCKIPIKSFQTQHQIFEEQKNQYDNWINKVVINNITKYKFDTYYNISKNQAELLLNQLEHKCTDNRTKFFIWEFCHNKYIRQYDDQQTVRNGNKKEYENFILGQTQKYKMNQNKTIEDQPEENQTIQQDQRIVIKDIYWWNELLITSDDVNPKKFDGDDNHLKDLGYYLHLDQIHINSNLTQVLQLRNVSEFVQESIHLLQSKFDENKNVIISDNQSDGEQILHNNFEFDIDPFDSDNKIMQVGFEINLNNNDTLKVIIRNNAENSYLQYKDKFYGLKGGQFSLSFRHLYFNINGNELLVVSDKLTQQNILNEIPLPKQDLFIKNVKLITKQSYNIKLCKIQFNFQNADFEQVHQHQIIEEYKNKDIFYYQTYDSGTYCKQIQQNRKTNIYYICSDSLMEIIETFEPSICVYEVIIGTKFMCTNYNKASYKELSEPKYFYEKEDVFCQVVRTDIPEIYEL